MFPQPARWAGQPVLTEGMTLLCTTFLYNSRELQFARIVRFPSALSRLTKGSRSTLDKVLIFLPRRSEPAGLNRHLSAL